MPFYASSPNKEGLHFLEAQDDGVSIKLEWYRAYPSNQNNKIVYNIYMDIGEPDFVNTYFNKSPVFVYTGTGTSTTITDLNPGQLYSFAVRAAEYDPSSFDYSVLPSNPSNPTLKYYPETILIQNISDTDVIIPAADISDFPNSGIIRIGKELINYTNLDLLNNNFVLTNSSIQRGYNDTLATIHTTSGFDGYNLWYNNILFFPVVSEEQNTVVYSIQSRFEHPHYSYTLLDGYKQETKDLLNTDLSTNEEIQSNFPPYDFSGWRRFSPLDIIQGGCIGSYIGGEYGCIDGYGNVSRVRGIPLNDINNGRLELMLQTTGLPAVLIKREHTGIRCSCYNAATQYPSARCLYCFGVGFVVGYYQYFSSRSSDGRILVRIGPHSRKVDPLQAGLEATDEGLEGWTLSTPIINQRDIIILYDKSDNELARFEVGAIGNNYTFDGLSGLQKMPLKRIRKTDIAYQINVYKNTSNYPQKIITSSSSAPGAISPHTHTIVLSEKINNITEINQLTSVDQGHNHYIKNGIVSTTLGHTHDILVSLPLLPP
jgi:hypothetical protein